VAAFEQRLVDMFRQEWRMEDRDAPLRSIVIVDQDPPAQYLYPEFLLFARLFERFGMRAIVTDPAALAYRDDTLWLDDTRVDVVYNRLTDFALEAPKHAALRAAYVERAAVVTPHPRAHALYADKRNLTLLGDSAVLRSFGATDQAIGILAASVPRTDIVQAGDAARLWAARKDLFFKPYAGFGSRGAYRGDKLTRRVFEEIMAGGYVAQALVPPTVHVAAAEHEPPLKLDVRNYAYGGNVQLLAARLWRGQTTNFRSSGGGFAPVFVLD
jgi:hypothetical protein